MYSYITIYKHSAIAVLVDHWSSDNMRYSYLTINKHSAIAQLVERPAVNGLVVGSNPTRGAKLYVASLLPRRFAPRQADCIVFAKIF